MQIPKSPPASGVTGSELEWRPVSALRPWVRNARTHSKKQVRQIADSIRRFGFTNPVLIDNEDAILAGHGRVAAAKFLGMDEVPCLRIERMNATRNNDEDLIQPIQLADEPSTEADEVQRANSPGSDHTPSNSE